MHIQRAIEQLGLSEQEAAVYLSALRLGITTVTEIAKKTSIPRTSCYGVIEKLQKKGLINYYPTGKKGRKRRFSAENPDKFLLIMRGQETLLKELLPQLKAIHRESGAKPTVYFYEGVFGIKQIFNDIIDRQYPFSAITSIEDAVQILGEFFNNFVRRRYQKKIPVKLLTNQTPMAQKLKACDVEELRRTRFLRKTQRFRTASFIYGSRVAMISFRKENPMGLIIEDEGITETQQMLFDIIWETTSQ